MKGRGIINKTKSMKLVKMMSIVIASVGVMAIAATVSAEGSGYGGDAPACTVYATPDTIEAGEGTMLNWDVNESVVSAHLHSKGSTSWMQEVPLDGAWWISGIVDSRDYVITVSSEDGQTSDCEVRITVGESTTEELTCDMYADPSTIEENGGTNLMWNSTGAVSAKLHPTGSTSYFADVSIDGSWWIGGIMNSRSYSVTLWDDNGNSVTCDAPIVVEEVIEEEGSECYDWDGDGWGWDGEKGCQVSTEDEGTDNECIDWDGDGWGWDGEKGCRMPV
jgi:hypothetical protein